MKSSHMLNILLPIAPEVTHDAGVDEGCLDTSTVRTFGATHQSSATRQGV